MRILFISNYFAPDGGAAAIRLTRLAERLAARGHEITVLTSLPHYPQGRIHEGYRGRWAVKEKRGALMVIQTWLWATDSPRISRKLISQISFMLTAFLRGLFLPRPDIIFVEAQPIFAGLAGMGLAFIKRRPYVLNVSDLWPDHLLSVGAMTERHPAYRAARFLVDTMYRRAAEIAVMSPHWGELIHHYIGRDTAVIYNGVDLIQFQPDLQTAHFQEIYGLTNKRIVAFIGTFATQYDFEMMLDIAHNFKDYSDVLFIWIGSGSQSEFIQKRLSTLEGVQFRLIPWLPADQIPLAWNSATLAYWALRDEPLYRGTIPAKLYEALACGVPIVAAMEGVGAELLQASGGGITVPCGDIQGLSDAITKLLDQPTLAQAYSQAGRAYAEAHFDPDKVAEAYEGLMVRANTI